MSRRLLSDGVQIKAAPTQREREIAALKGQTLTAEMPTETQVRDAIARLVKSLDNMRISRGYSDWTVEDGSFNPTVVVTAEHEVVLRGGIIITRAD